MGLSEDGRRQASKTADLLSRESLAAVYSSPLRRAVETATIIAQRHRLAVQSVESLQEADVGRWESRSWQEIAQTEPDAYRRFMDDGAAFGYPGGENFEQVRDRAAPAIERLLLGHLGHGIAIVGHNVVWRVFLAHAIGLPISKARRVVQDNCGVSVVNYKAGSLAVLTLNTTFHL